MYLQNISYIKNYTMKTNILLNIIFSIFGMIGCGKTFSQEVKDSKESQEIIIKKKGDKSTKLTVEINGSSILINGKTIAEFKEDGITINNRKMIIRDGDKLTMMFDEMQMPMLEKLEGLEGLSQMQDFSFYNNGNPQQFGNKRLMLGVITETKEKEGALIEEVIKNSPAEKAGLQKDDIIYKIDDVEILSRKTLVDFIPTKKEGDKLKIYFTRAGKKMDAIATLEIKDAAPRIRVERNIDGTREMELQEGDGDMKVFRFNNDQQNDARETMKVMMGRNRMGNRLGIKIQDTEQEDGVKVIEVEKESLSATAGLQKDDIIIAIADKAIKNTDEAREALNENKAKSSYSVKVKRNGKEVMLEIKVPKKLKTANL